MSAPIDKMRSPPSLQETIVEVHHYEEGDEDEWDDESSLGSLLHEQRRNDDYVPSQAYKARLKRRTMVIRELRNAYLRDVISLKYLIDEMLTNDERSVILQQWEDAIPSIDLSQHFMLYSPAETSFAIIPCESCGGSLELVHHDSDAIAELSNQLKQNDKGKSELKVIIASKVAMIEGLQKEMGEKDALHRSEKKVLFTEMKELRAVSNNLQKLNEKLQEINQAMRLENTDLKNINSDAIQTREELRAARVEIECLQSKIRALEEEVYGKNEVVKLQMEQLMEAESTITSLRKNITDMSDEVAQCRESSETNKGTSELLSKKNARLEQMLEKSRKDVEGLQSLRSSLQIDYETLQQQSTAEIENLEKVVDTLRDEKERVFSTLNEQKDNYTHLLHEKEVVEQDYSECYMTYTAYKGAKEPEIERLHDHISDKDKKNRDLSGQVKSLEEWVKTAEHRAVTAEDRLKESDDRCASQNIEIVELQRRIDELTRAIEESKLAAPAPAPPAKRGSVMVRTGSLENKQSSKTTPAGSGRPSVVSIPEGTAPSIGGGIHTAKNGVISVSSDATTKPTASSGLTSGSAAEMTVKKAPRLIVKREKKDIEGQSKVPNRGDDGGTAKKTPPLAGTKDTLPGRLTTTVTETKKNAAAQKPSDINVLLPVSTSEVEGIVKKEPKEPKPTENELAMFVLKRLKKRKYLPEAKIRGKKPVQGKASGGQEPDVPTASPAAKSSMKDSRVTENTSAEASDVVCDAVEADKKTSPVLTAPPPSANYGKGANSPANTMHDMSSSSSNREVNQHAAPVPADAGSDEDEEGDSFATLPSSSPVTSSVTQTASHIIDNGSSSTALNAAVGGHKAPPLLTRDDSLRRNTALAKRPASLPPLSADEDGGDDEDDDGGGDIEDDDEGSADSSDSDIDDDGLDLREEMARTWRMISTQLGDALMENMDADLATSVRHVLTPVTISLSTFFAGAVTAMWQLLESTKLHADSLCKLRALEEFMKPFLEAMESKHADALKKAKITLRDPKAFLDKSEKWIASRPFDMELMETLKLQLGNPSVYVEGDLQDRQAKIDIILDTVSELLDYQMTEANDVEYRMKDIFFHMIDTKEMLLRAGDDGQSRVKVDDMSRSLNDIGDKSVQLESVLRDGNSTDTEAVKDSVALVKELQLRNTELQQEIATVQEALGTFRDQNNLLQDEVQTLLDQLHETTVNLTCSNDSNRKNLEQISHLQQLFNTEHKLLKEVKEEMARKNDKEEQRLNGMVHVTVQTRSSAHDQSIQTDFYVPPMGLLNELSVHRSGTAGSRRPVKRPITSAILGPQSAPYSPPPAPPVTAATHPTQMTSLPSSLSSMVPRNQPIQHQQIHLQHTQLSPPSISVSPSDNLHYMPFGQWDMSPPHSGVKVTRSVTSPADRKSDSPHVLPSVLQQGANRRLHTNPLGGDFPDRYPVSPDPSSVNLHSPALTPVTTPHGVSRPRLDRSCSTGSCSGNAVTLGLAVRDTTLSDEKGRHHNGSTSGTGNSSSSTKRVLDSMITKSLSLGSIGNDIGEDVGGDFEFSLGSGDQGSGMSRSVSFSPVKSRMSLHR